MKKRLCQFITTYMLFVILFALQKPFFMFFYSTLFKDATISDYINVIWHGLPLDLSLAGYLTVIPCLVLLLTAWIDVDRLILFKKYYFGIIAFMMAFLFIIDMGLYSFWGFRLDATPFFYFFSSPKEAFASVSFFYILKGIAAILLYASVLYGIFYGLLIYNKKPLKIPYKRITVSFFMLLLMGLLFIPIRGGFSVSTMNVSKAYFSSNQRMNHAAINPIFSLMYSLSHQKNFDKQYRFMDARKADLLFAELQDKSATDSIPQLLKTKRPNIIFVVLESFSNHIMKSLGGTPGVAINMDKYAEEGVLFTHFYANSFRTDRGLVSIFSGYPAQPTTSIMKYPEKTESLPSIPRSLKKAGYNLQYYYGGDIDFTNMRSYLISSGIVNIVADKDFPLPQRSGKWGVHDQFLFERVLADLKTTKQTEPFFKAIQTSSSHEPFEVPFHKLQNKRLNAFAYADDCLGRFITQLKSTSLWSNTLVVLVPDHLGGYPYPMDAQQIESHQIPLILIGGALKAPKKVDTYASQIDIAATLLNQLQIPHSEFAFSKNILNAQSPHFGYFTVPNAFGMITSENQLVFNCESNLVQTNEGRHKGANLEKGKAFLQKLYDDLAKR